MTGRNSLHYCYDVSYQCWFASEEAKIYRNNFNSSNAVVCSHLILAYTVRLAIINATEMERNGWFFFIFFEECCVVIEKNIDKKLENRIRYQIWYKQCLKGKFGRGGSKSAEGGPNPLWHRARSQMDLVINARQSEIFIKMPLKGSFKVLKSIRCLLGNVKRC